jgi:CelD/BcsL family acetyltransferase involved in cellulose biosynthesis
MFVERLWVGPVLVRVAKLVGCDHALTLCSVAIEPAHAREALRQIMEYWPGERRCDAVWFGPLTGANDTAQNVREASSAVPHARIIREVELGCHTTFHLPATFEEFVSSLNKRQRQNYRRDNNLLARSFKIETDVITDPAVALEEFERFCGMHERQWRAEGKLGHFGDWPGATEFNRELVREQAKLSRVRFYRLLADGQVISCQYGFRFGQSLTWRLPARPVGAQWDRFGLGRLGLMKMLEAAIGEGVRRVEAGMGHYDYKTQLGGQETPVHSLLVASTRGASPLKIKALAKLSDALHLAYYRAWFLKLSPKLRLPPRPLWRYWIRHRM